MKSHQYTALVEAVEIGLYRGWDSVHEYSPHPRKKKLLDGLLTAIMVSLDKLINDCSTETSENNER